MLMLIMTKMTHSMMRDLGEIKDLVFNADITTQEVIHIVKSLKTNKASDGNIIASRFVCWLDCYHIWCVSSAVDLDNYCTIT